MTGHPMGVYPTKSALFLVATCMIVAPNTFADTPRTKLRTGAPIRESVPGPETGRSDANREFDEGVRLADGDGIPRDYALAAVHYRKAADAGHSGAQYNLAVLYAEGRGVEQSFPEAAKWYRRAAGSGDPEAQNNLGVLYATGQGVARDDAEAVRWYRLAASNGDLEGTTNLGSMLLQGRGVARNLEEAFRLFRFAAEGGYAIAQNNLGIMYANGQATERDSPVARPQLPPNSILNSHQRVHPRQRHRPIPVHDHLPPRNAPEVRHHMTRG